MKKFLLSCALATACFAIPLSAFASNWVFYSTDSYNTSYYADIDSIRVMAPNQRSIWTKSLSPDGSYSLSLWLFDNRLQSSQVLSITDYSPNGTVTFSANYPFSPANWDPIVPDSIGAELYSTAWANEAKS